MIDGSTDGSGDALAAAFEQDARVKVITLASNQGKGAAVLHAAGVFYELYTRIFAGRRGGSGTPPSRTR